MQIYSRNTTGLMAITVIALLTSACGSDNPPVAATTPAPTLPALPEMANFEVTVTNLTNAQPLSPVAVIAHQAGDSVFSIGTAATAGLETLAEGGDNSALIAEAAADTTVMATASEAAPIGPAGSETVTIQVLESELPGLSISTSTMLVNTNDAITGVNRIDVASLAAGDSVTMRSIAYDTGTEANTEAAAHIPGPAGGGEGFNTARDDIADRVAMHSGVVSEDDRVLGLETGADDYLTKPFSVLELAARVRAIFRRVENLKSLTPRNTGRDDCIAAGSININPSRRHVTLSGNKVELTAREFDLLEHFARHPGRVFRRSELLDQVWGYGHEGYEHTVNSHINRLRSKIESNSSQPEVIVTVWGVGYKFSDQAA
jgi:DNA-binding response OmpR family regulator